MLLPISTCSGTLLIIWPQEVFLPILQGWWLLFSHSIMYSCLDPVDCSLPGSSVHGVLQARILEWVDISSSRGSSPIRGGTHVSCFTHVFFTAEPPACLERIIFHSFPPTGMGFHPCPKGNMICCPVFLIQGFCLIEEIETKRYYLFPSNAPKNDFLGFLPPCFVMSSY